MKEIQEHKIKIYEFPETDDEEENKLVKKIKVWNVIWKQNTPYYVKMAPHPIQSFTEASP